MSLNCHPGHVSIPHTCPEPPSTVILYIVQAIYEYNGSPSGILITYNQSNTRDKTSFWNIVSNSMYEHWHTRHVLVVYAFQLPRCARAHLEGSNPNRLTIAPPICGAIAVGRVRHPTVAGMPVPFVNIYILPVGNENVFSALTDTPRNLTWLQFCYVSNNSPGPCLIALPSLPVIAPLYRTPFGSKSMLVVNSNL